MTFWSCATESSSAAPAEPMPALLTSTSSRPKRPTPCSTAAVTEASLETSRSTKVPLAAGELRCAAAGPDHLEPCLDEAKSYLLTDA
jgi:hypothetical protein